MGTVTINANQQIYGCWRWHVAKTGLLVTTEIILLLKCKRD